MALSDLQTLLDNSKAAASTFTKQLAGEELSAQQVEDFINQARNVTVAVVRKDGSPHATPLIGGCVEGEIHVTVSPGSVLANCLQRNPKVAFTIADLVHSVIGAGTAENLGRVSDLPDLCRQLDQASPYGSFAPAGWDGLIYRLEPIRLFAF